MISSTNLAMETLDNDLSYFENGLKLETIFMQIISSKDPVELSLKKLKYIIETDLNLDEHQLGNLDDIQTETLPYMLKRYIQNWPGWSKKVEYDNGFMDLDSWMSRFRNYICYKMSVLVTVTLQDIEEELETSKEVVDVGTQSDLKVNFASFNIDLTGPATIMNNLVFSGYEGNIGVEEHAERTWVPLEYTDIVNYPYVEVEFNSAELSFKRSFDPKISQYLSCSSDYVAEKTNFILKKTGINSSCSNRPIKLTTLESYIKSFKVGVSSQLPLQQQVEYCIVLDQFYQDMIDISTKNGVYGNRRVTFNIGRGMYKRTKKISNRDGETDVVFNEILLPRVISSFRYFGGMEQYSVGKKVVITYKCMFCKITFDGLEARSALLEHIEVLHRRAQTIVCLKCKRCMEIAELSRRRWKCTCL